MNIMIEKKAWVVSIFRPDYQLSNCKVAGSFLAVSSFEVLVSFFRYLGFFVLFLDLFEDFIVWYVLGWNL
ncbi:MAG: hypothetical protein JSW00_00845 [Thermoplasmata archaeon]|nr:MAG: hypothetical protein JSW00_00845 [Thermoplasmata archaeon]